MHGWVVNSIPDLYPLKAGSIPSTPVVNAKMSLDTARDVPWRDGRWESVGGGVGRKTAPLISTTNRLFRGISLFNQKRVNVSLTDVFKQKQKESNGTKYQCVHKEKAKLD